MFRTGGGFNSLLDKATSQLLMEPDWNTFMQICDLVRQNDVQPKIALNGIKKKIASPNPHTAMFAVQLLESMVKNCGSAITDELMTRVYCDSLYELVKTTPHDNVKQKMLELIQTWTFAFRKNAKYSALKDTMNLMKAEGNKFPAMRESDAMFSADTAPKWSDGEFCHRCRVQFTLVLRKHHCRACGQVFCATCSSKTSTLPKFGIEKEVRVCEACFDSVNKPAAAAAVASNGSKDADMAEYLKSSLAQQSQAPPRKTEEELREEEEFNLALALSQSEAEHKEKEKMRVTSAYFKQEPAAAPRQSDRTPSPDDQQASNPELARYLNRSYWENRQSDDPGLSSNSPSAPATAPTIHNNDNKMIMRDNMIGGFSTGLTDSEMEEFVKTLKGQVEIFINRMKSNSSRGRSIATDSSVQTLFMNITAMHSKLLRYIQQHDDSRLHYERLQDKLTQVKDARAALDALREEHREKLRRQAEEAERQRQMQMAHKLDIMRKKKQEYLQYHRQLALQRIQEQEREMLMRQEQQKQQYIMAPQFGYMGSPVHGPFQPNNAPPGGYGYQYGQPMMSQLGHPQMGHPMQFQQQNMPPGMQGLPPHMQPGQQNMQPGQQNMQPGQQNMQPGQQNMQPGQQNMQPGQQGMQHNMGGPPNMPPQNQHMPQNMGASMQQNLQPQPNMQQNMPPNLQAQPNMQQNLPPPGSNVHAPGAQQALNMSPQYQQPGAPPASPQIPQAQQNGETQSVAELISFD